MQDKLLTSVDHVSQFLQGKKAAFRKKALTSKKEALWRNLRGWTLYWFRAVFSDSSIFSWHWHGISQLSCRFQGMRAITSSFSCIHPRALKGNKDKNLTLAYPNHLSDDFPSQLLSFRCILKTELKKLATIREIAELLIMKHSSIMTSVSGVATAFKIFLTIPVIVALQARKGLFQSLNWSRII